MPVLWNTSIFSSWSSSCTSVMNIISIMVNCEWESFGSQKLIKCSVIETLLEKVFVISFCKLKSSLWPSMSINSLTWISSVINLTKFFTVIPFLIFIIHLVMLNSKNSGTIVFWNSCHNKICVSTSLFFIRSENNTFIGLHSCGMGLVEIT